MASPAAKPPAPFVSWFLHWDAHHRFLASLGAAGLVFGLLYGRVALWTGVIMAWDAFALTYVVAAWAGVIRADPYEVRRTARLQDTSATFLFIVVVLAALGSLLAAVFLLAPAKGLSHADLGGHLGLSISAVGVSWMLVHTLFILRYAHHYYDDARSVAREKIDGGLLFPGEEKPGYIDFAYFSFVIGMTCQVSDVQITSSRLRRLALVHGLISFAFNTAILAVVINLVAGLI